MATQKPAGGAGGAGKPGGAGSGKAGPLKAGPGAARVTGGAASAVGAKAFTSGNDIHLKPGAGPKPLAHEAAHVVQQGAGKLKPGPGAKPR